MRVNYSNGETVGKLFGDFEERLILFPSCYPHNLLAPRYQKVPVLSHGSLRCIQDRQEDTLLIFAAVCNQGSKFVVCHLNGVLNVIFEKFICRYMKSICDGNKGVKTHTLQSTFYVTDISWRFVDDFRELLL